MKIHRTKTVFLAMLLLYPLGKAFAYSPPHKTYLPSPNSTVIDAGTDDAHRTSINFDTKGNALTVFEQKTGDVYRIYANRYVRGKGWEGPHIIDAGTGNAYRGKVAFDQNGNAIAVFKQGDNGVYRIYANQYIDGKGWQGPVPIDNGKGEVDGQQIAFNKSGNAVAVFEQFEGKTYGIFVNWYVKGVGWQGATRIDIVSKQKAQGPSQAENSNAYFPYPAFDYKGNLYVVYYKEGGSGLNPYVSRYDSKWSDPVRIGSGIQAVKKEEWVKKKSKVSRGVKGIYNPLFLGELKKRIYSGTYKYRTLWWVTPSKMDSRFRGAYTPSIVINENGDVTAFYVKWDGTHLRGYATAYKAESGWSAPRLIDGGTGDVEYVRASINRTGEIAVVFTQWVGDNLRIHGRVYHPNTGWGEAEIIDAGAKDAYNPSVVFASNGTIVAVWCQWEKTSVKSYTNSYQKGQGWKKAVRLEHEEGETCGVKVAAGPDGRVIAIYEQEAVYPDRRLPVNKMYAVELK